MFARSIGTATSGKSPALGKSTIGTYGPIKPPCGLNSVVWNGMLNAEQGNEALGKRFRISIVLIVSNPTEEVRSLKV